jgi:hypothetical protein
MAEPKLADHLADLGLPPKFTERRADASRAVKKLMRLHDTAIKTTTKTGRRVRPRNYLTGLLIGFVAVAEDLLAQTKKDKLSDPLRKYPPAERDRSGNRLYTLKLLGPEKEVALRPYYNRAERVIRGKLRRRDYPNMAPHATQAWRDYEKELVTIFGLSPSERLALVESLWEVIAAMPKLAARPKSSKTARPFEVLLRFFPAGQGDPPGALLQGFAFAYYRADAPNVTLETLKVGAGGSRTGNVGDIDGWSGDNLVLSIEVKDRDIDGRRVDEIASGFLVNLSEWPDATAIVLARSFTDEAKKRLRRRNVRVLDRKRMRSNVRLWDIRKQQLAMREFKYFLFRKQQRSSLLARFEKFVADHALVFE